MFFMNQHDYLKKPFFAKFLESQIASKATAGQTEGFVDPITKPLLDMEHTLKFPSDGDEI
jgi:hypothetical protein